MHLSNHVTKVRERNKQLHRNYRAVKNWMDSNRLKMNASKEEYKYINLCECENRNLDVNGKLVERSDIVKYLGICMDEQLDMKKHITEICRKPMYRLYRLNQVWKVVTDKAAETIAE